MATNDKRFRVTKETGEQLLGTEVFMGVAYSSAAGRLASLQNRFWNLDNGQSLTKDASDLFKIVETGEVVRDFTYIE